MREFSIGQLKTLSEYFNMIAAAWFTAGIISPFFSKAVPLEKALFSIAGLGVSYVFLNFSLFFAKEVNP